MTNLAYPLTYESNEDRLTPDEYLKLTPEQKKDICDIRIIPPVLGARNPRRSSGSILVKYKSPIYKQL